MDERLDRLPCGILSFADDGTIAEINGTLLDLLGYRREELEGASIGAVLSTGSRIFVQTHISPMLRLQGRLEEIFLILRQRDGGDLGALVNAVRCERHGTHVNDCVVVRVRERQKYEEELLRARKAAEQAHAALALEQERLRAAHDALMQRSEELTRQRRVAVKANRAKSAFLSFMSHELRTPLTSILGFAQLLQLSDLPVEDEESVGHIVTAGRHLLALINEVLDLSAIEAGRISLTPEPVSVEEAVGVSLALVRVSAAARGIEILQDAIPGGERHVLADGKRLQQVLLNLLSNAIKYNRDGGRVRVRFEDRAEDGIRILVEDTGRGIPAGRLGDLFTPFERLGAESGSVEGTGLGLALCRELIHAMSGRIGVDSVADRGSTFWIELPEAPREAVGPGSDHPGLSGRFAM